MGHTPPDGVPLSFCFNSVASWVSPNLQMECLFVSFVPSWDQWISCLHMERLYHFFPVQRPAMGFRPPDGVAT